MSAAGVGIDRNPRFWSDTYETFLAQNVVPGLLPARQSYLSVTELESRLGGSFNSYDQYEVCVCVCLCVHRSGGSHRVSMCVCLTTFIGFQSTPFLIRSFMKGAGVWWGVKKCQKGLSLQPCSPDALLGDGRGGSQP